jgi:hypothetical protein
MRFSVSARFSPRGAQHADLYRRLKALDVIARLGAMEMMLAVALEAALGVFVGIAFHQEHCVMALHKLKHRSVLPWKVLYMYYFLLSVIRTW